MTNSESCNIWLPIEFHGFTSRINSKVLSQFFRDGMGPFKFAIDSTIMKVTQPFEQNVITHTQGLLVFVCNIKEF